MTLLLAKRRTKRMVLFLCTGDTCRGPMAQGYMKHALSERGMKNVEVRTAGVMTIAGLIPTPEASQVMKNAGIDINSHRSTPLTRELIRKADLILGMSPFHVQHALRESPEAKGKTYLLKEFAASDMKNYQITDPMGATLEVYKRVYREMKLAIDKMLDKDFFTAPLEDDRRRPKKVTPAKEEEEDDAEAAPAPAKKPAAAASKPAAVPAKTATSPAKPAAGKSPAAPSKPAAKGTPPPPPPAKKKVGAK